jgi:hypothetical protein
MFGSLIFGAALACDLPQVDRRLEAANEHAFWADFWDELDPREAAAERGYCLFELKAAIALTQDADCDTHRRAQILGRYAREHARSQSAFGCALISPQPPSPEPRIVGLR